MLTSNLPVVLFQFSLSLAPSHPFVPLVGKAVPKKAEDEAKPTTSKLFDTDAFTKVASPVWVVVPVNVELPLTVRLPPTDANPNVSKLLDTEA